MIHISFVADFVIPEKEFEADFTIPETDVVAEDKVDLSCDVGRPACPAISIPFSADF